MAKHFLYNSLDELIIELDTFDSDLLKKTTVEYLMQNPQEQITHEKEITGKDKIKFFGNDIINVYANNKKGQPSKLIFKGNKESYATLS